MHAEHALLERRQQVSAASRAAPLVDTRTSGRAPTILRRSQRLARVVIPVLCKHGIRESPFDRSACLFFRTLKRQLRNNGRRFGVHLCGKCKRQVYDRKVWFFVCVRQHVLVILIARLVSKTRQREEQDDSQNTIFPCFLRSAQNSELGFQFSFPGRVCSFSVDLSQMVNRDVGRLRLNVVEWSSFRCDTAQIETRVLAHVQEVRGDAVLACEGELEAQYRTSTIDVDALELFQRLQLVVPCLLHRVLCRLSLLLSVIWLRM